jgi:hypothetical protein
MVIIIAVLFFSYNGKNADRAALAQDMSAASATLSEVTSQKHTLETEKAQLSSRLEMVKAAQASSSAVMNFPLESIEYGTEILEDITASNLTVISLGATEPTTTKTGNLTSLSMGFQIVVKGNREGATSFINALVSRENLAGISIINLDVTKTDQINEVQVSVSLVAHSFKSS